ncbi:sulfatase-like hydrolase/transferase [Planctomycetota bacterium]
MNRRDFLKAATAAGVSITLGGCAESVGFSRKKQTKPNIVFFLVDDMGWQNTSEPFYKEVTPLNKKYHTPNMEALADEGVKFTQAYAYALCSPTRVSLMTGLSAARHRVTTWTLKKDFSYDRPHPTLNPPKWNINGLSPVPDVDGTCYANTFPMFLQKAGYRTIHVGKAHWGAQDTPGSDPKALGFDVNIAGHYAGGVGSHYARNNFGDTSDPIWDPPGLEEYYGKDMYLTEVLTIEANKQMDKAVADGKPFYLYMSHYATHAPFETDDRFSKKYQHAGLSGVDLAYATMIEGMDKSLGDIRANIKRLGIEDNTIVVFMTDNGAPDATPRNLPLKGHKLHSYEGGPRVPMIVKWPGVTKPDSICEDYMIVEDIFPTFLEMAGVKDYDQIGGKIDGISFVPLLKQKKGYPKDRPLFWHFPHNYVVEPFSVIRKGDWKLIYFYTDEHFELYNIKDDIGESNNLVDRNKDTLRSLADELRLFLIEANADMPIIKSTEKPVPLPTVQ